MKQTSRITSTYSADTMGVCSALFELGGMTIMHDASGCNSTYTTHDEPRWYDMDSMVYISGLTEMEAIMGDDEKLLGDIEDAVRELHPKFVAIAGTPIPTMTGFDFEAVAALAEERTGVPCFGFPTTGMNTYIHGASLAFEALAERFAEEVPEKGKATEGIAADGEKTKANILGLTPLDFSVNGQDASIAEWLESEGIEVVSRWAMGSSADEIAMAGAADVNLVVSASGLAAARVLQERFGTPYAVGLPIGDKLSGLLADMIKAKADIEERETGVHPDIFLSIDNSAADPYETGFVAVIGEGITSLSLAKAVELECGIPAKVICATECPEDLLRDCDRIAPDEEDIMEEIKDAAFVIADPLYKPICPETASFISLPSEAFSGRLYRSDIPNLIANPEAILDQLK